MILAMSFLFMPLMSSSTGLTSSEYLRSKSGSAPLSKSMFIRLVFRASYTWLRTWLVAGATLSIFVNRVAISCRSALRLEYFVTHVSTLFITSSRRALACMLMSSTCIFRRLSSKSSFITAVLASFLSISPIHSHTFLKLDSSNCPAFSVVTFLTHSSSASFAIDSIMELLAFSTFDSTFESFTSNALATPVFFICRTTQSRDCSDVTFGTFHASSALMSAKSCISLARSTFHGRLFLTNDGSVMSEATSDTHFAPKEGIAKSGFSEANLETDFKASFTFVEVSRLPALI